MELEGTSPKKPCDKKLSKHHVIYASDINMEVKEHLPRNPVIRKKTPPPPHVNKSDLNIELEGTPPKKPHPKIKNTSDLNIHTNTYYLHILYDTSIISKRSNDQP